MLPVTARSAAAAVGAVSVANRRGRVQHLTPSDGLAVTPRGTVRAGRRPVCGQPARRWSVTEEDDPRRLCRRCLSQALRAHPDLHQLIFTAAPADLIEKRLRTVTDPAELALLTRVIVTRHDLLHHVITDYAFGALGRRRLTALVPEARARCTNATTNTASSVRSPR